MNKRPPPPPSGVLVFWAEVHAISLALSDVLTERSKARERGETLDMFDPIAHLCAERLALALDRVGAPGGEKLRAALGALRSQLASELNAARKRARGN